MYNMKTLLISSLIVVSSVLAHAQAEPEQKKGRRGSPSPEIIAKFDKDGDGKLNREEKKAAREARRAEMVAKFDKDGDGELNTEEKAALRADRKARREARFDKDGDGKLSKEERRAMRRKLGKLRGKGKGPRRGGKPQEPQNLPQ